MEFSWKIAENIGEYGRYGKTLLLKKLKKLAIFVKDCLFLNVDFLKIAYLLWDLLVFACFVCENFDVFVVKLMSWTNSLLKTDEIDGRNLEGLVQ